MHTCIRDESGTAGSPVSGSGGRGVCVRVMVTESLRSNDELNLTLIVRFGFAPFWVLPRRHPEMVGPVTGQSRTRSDGNALQRAMDGTLVAKESRRTSAIASERESH